MVNLNLKSHMFEKLKSKSFTVSQERFDTLIGRTTTIHGRLVLLDSVRIDGKVLGNIETAPGNKIRRHWCNGRSDR